MGAEPPADWSAIISDGAALAGIDAHHGAPTSIHHRLGAPEPER